MPMKSVKKTAKETVKKATKKAGTGRVLKSDAVIPANGSFFEDVRRILAVARRQAYAAVNFVLVEAYWKI